MYGVLRQEVVTGLRHRNLKIRGPRWNLVSRRKGNAARFARPPAPIRCGSRCTFSSVTQRRALAKYVLSASNINADDTPIKVLAPGSGKTKRGHLWTYVRDGTAWGSTDPPAVWYQYSPSWHGKYPQRHLAAFTGKLQVDAYAGFEPLLLPTKPGVAARVEEISCMAHARRKMFDLYVALDSPLGKEAIERIGGLYQIENHIRGSSP